MYSGGVSVQCSSLFGRAFDGTEASPLVLLKTGVEVLRPRWLWIIGGMVLMEENRNSRKNCLYLYVYTTLASWIGHIWRRNWLLKHVIEGNKEL
jgi:hypothetical protein